jgi:hypothetical protein
VRVGSDGELNVKERPILFSAPMVRAILAGQKTQTRRVVKARKDPDFGCQMSPGEIAGDEHQERLCPYGQPGDRLWVRETWAYGTHALSASRDEDGPFVYAADAILFGAQGRLCDRWRPSIHMPRWASRITLEVTGVRVERLQDISVADAIAEGVVECNQNLRGLEPCMEWRYAYEDLWGQINGQGSWDANPWVWVVSFNVRGNAHLTAAGV